MLVLASTNGAFALFVTTTTDFLSPSCCKRARDVYDAAVKTGVSRI
ncbi:MAG: hypothetical protein IKB27_02295 [Clostridia bacterium]|nr:hypothetical protein [Clostridia bacterium]